MNIAEIFAAVEAVGARLVVIDGKLKATPRGALPVDLKAAILERIVEIKARLMTKPAAGLSGGNTIIEMAFGPAPAARVAAPEMPECPVCGASRFWFSGGFLRCGSKRCESQPRFVLTRIEFHSLQ